MLPNNDPGNGGEPSEANRCAVYIVDDDPEVRRSTWLLLDASGFAPRAFTGGADFLHELDYLKPGVVILDLRMPEPDGFQVLEALRRGGSFLPVIVISGYGSVTTAVGAMKLGAVDFIEKPFDRATIIAAIEQAAASLNGGQRRRRDDDARPRIDALSARERDVLRCLAAGLPNKSIAHQMGLSPRTIEMHRANMMEHLGVRSLPDALRLAFRAGLEPWSTPGA